MKRLPWSLRGRLEVEHRIESIREKLANVFYYNSYSDTQILDFILVPAATLHWRDENPLWCQIVGSPGSGKTAHLDFVKGWFKSVFVSRVSKNSLISGYRDTDNPEEDPSLLLELDGKLFVVKDFTCILQGPREERDAVVGQLRDIFDGDASRSFGNIGLQQYSSRFNMVIAVTNVIDGYHQVTSQLGERFISRREDTTNRLSITSAAFDNVYNGRREDAVECIRLEVRQFLSRLPRISVKNIMWSTDMVNRASIGADFIARARSHVPRERDGVSIATRPAPEVGTRLVTQIVQMITGFCLVNGLNEVNEDAWEFGGARILRDTMPTPVSWVLYHIHRMSKEIVDRGRRRRLMVAVKDILPETRLGYRTTHQIVVDLHHNGVLDAMYVGETGSRNTRYRLSDNANMVIKETKMFNSFDLSSVDIGSVVSSSKLRDRRPRV